MITWGILGAYLVGMAVFFIAPGLAYAVDWRVLLGVGFIISIVGLILLLLAIKSISDYYGNSKPFRLCKTCGDRSARCAGL